MKPYSALIIGVSGQDGHFLAEHLSSNGCLVHGLDILPPKTKKCIFKNIDISNYDAFNNYLKTIRPDKIFYLSAIHGSFGFKYEDKLNLINVNTVGVHVCLEYARTLNRQCVFVYASSILALKENKRSEISEESELDRSSLYGITKNAATDLVYYYKTNYNILASIVRLSNHESNMRSKDFFSYKIVNPLKLALKNQAKNERIKVNTLDFWKDWGYAKEFMMIMSLISEKTPGVNYVLSTGKFHYARDLVKDLYAFYGFDYIDFIDEVNFDMVQRENNFCINTINLKNRLKVVPILSGIEVFKQLVND